MTYVRRKGLLASAAERGEHTDSGQLLENDSFMVFHDCHGGDTFDDGQIDRSKFCGAAQNAQKTERRGL